MAHCAILLILAVTSVRAAQPLALEETEPGRVIARTADGAILWSADRPSSCGPLTYEIDEQGRILIDQTMLVDRHGRVLAHLEHRGAPMVVRAPRPEVYVWESPIEIGEAPFDYNASTPPVIDSSGNAWVALNGATEFGLEVIQVTRSTGHSGIWTPPETLYEASATIFQPRLVIDPSDRITVAYRETPSGLIQLNVLRYLPSVGWEGPQTVYTSGTSGFYTVNAAADAVGNVVTSFDGANSTAMYAAVYDAATDTWGEATRLSPASAALVTLPTLIQNRSGTYLYAVYKVESNPGRGIYVRRFRSATLDFAPPQRVPGTGLADIPGGIHTDSRIPAAVDDQGNVTVPFYVNIELAPTQWLHLLRTARLEAGVWIPPVTVMAHIGSEQNLPSLTDFADIDYSAGGDVMMVFKRSAPTGIRLMALRYNANVRTWDPPSVIYTDNAGVMQRTRIAFRSDGGAVATYADFNVNALSSRLFDGAVWVPGAFSVPGNSLASLHETTADGLDVILIYDDFVREFATWFRDSALSDSGRAVP